MTGLVGFSARVTSPVYARLHHTVAGTPQILMLSRVSSYPNSGDTSRHFGSCECGDSGASVEFLAAVGVDVFPDQRVSALR